MSQKGFKPTKKCIKAILKLVSSSNIKETRGFLGMTKFIKRQFASEMMSHKNFLTTKHIYSHWWMRPQIFQLALIPTANSRSCTKIFNFCWLCLYHHLNTVGHDNGNEFIGWGEFQEILSSQGIKSHPTTVKKLTLQSVIKCLHLTIRNMLLTLLYQEDDQGEDVATLIRACSWAPLHQI